MDERVEVDDRTVNDVDGSAVVELTGATEAELAVDEVVEEEA
jgi:hypothetical protein